MSEYTVPTVRIVAPVTDDNPLGYIVINESDRAESDQIFDDKPAEAEKPAKPRRSTAAEA